MRASFDIRSLVVGGVLVGMVVLLAGAVGTDPLPEIGRYQLSCTQKSCYLVDSMTGQVWHDRLDEFRERKIKSRTAKAKEAEKKYLGRWDGTTADQEQLSVHLKADGLLHLKDGKDKEYIGTWRLAGNRITITLSVNDSTLAGQLYGDGRLMLWQRGDEDSRVILRPVK